MAGAILVAYHLITDVQLYMMQLGLKLVFFSSVSFCGRAEQIRALDSERRVLETLEGLGQIRLSVGGVKVWESENMYTIHAPLLFDHLISPLIR